jgi:hypothetical protein
MKKHMETSKMTALCSRCRQYENPITVDLTESNIQNTVTEGDADDGLIPWNDPDTSLVYDIPAQGDYCLDFNGDYIRDIDFTDGKVVVYEDEEAADDNDNDNDKK